MPTKGRLIKTAIIVDMMGCGGQSQEEEIAELTERYGEIFAPARLDVHTPAHAGDGSHGIQQGTELVLYDFGGLMPGSSLMEDNARLIIKWAENHPSALVIVVSRFTFTHLIEPEMRGLGLMECSTDSTEIHNIVCEQYKAEDFIPEWFLSYARGEE